MGTRIRYVRTGVTPTEIRSARTFCKEDMSFFIFIDVAQNSYLVSRAETPNIPVIMGSGKSLHDVKIQAKKALESLGIKFNNEERRGKDV